MNTRLVIAALCVFLIGCDARNQSALDEINTPAVPAAFDKQETSANHHAEPLERKLIKNGELSFKTADIQKTKAAIDAICKELNAYTSNENQNNYGSELQYNQTIRVSADTFDLLIQKIEAEAREVIHKTINTQDVTEEFMDVEARLKTKKELEARYREILKQAKSVEEILSIENQFATVRSDIESMEGRLKYLTNQVAYSTLHVSYVQTLGTDFGFASKLVKGFSSGWDYFLLFLVGLVNIWPFLILAGITIGLLLRCKKRRHKKS